MASPQPLSSSSSSSSLLFARKYFKFNYFIVPIPSLIVLILVVSISSLPSLCYARSTTNSNSNSINNNKNDKNNNKQHQNNDNDAIFANLSKAIVDRGGYVHPSLSWASPAPCGADRGIVIRMTGTRQDDTIVCSNKNENENENEEQQQQQCTTTTTIQQQQPILYARIPPSYQLTRSLALATLTPIIPPHVLKYAPLSTLDDAALLVLLLVHLKGGGGGGNSSTHVEGGEWDAYLESLPDHPGCGWWTASGSPDDDNDNNNNASSEVQQQQQQQKLKEYSIPQEALQLSKGYVRRVSLGMANDYGAFLASDNWPKEWKTTTMVTISGSGDGDRGGIEDTSPRDRIASAARAIEWSLCIVSSRGTAASPEYGGGEVRLVPLADLFNHNVKSVGFQEVTITTHDGGGDGNTSKYEEEHFGSFEVKSSGRNNADDKGLVDGDEITVDYNLVDFSPEEWFLSHGFVPPELRRHL